MKANAFFFEEYINSIVHQCINFLQHLHPTTKVFESIQSSYVYDAVKYATHKATWIHSIRVGNIKPCTLVLYFPCLSSLTFSYLLTFFSPNDMFTFLLLYISLVKSTSQ